MCIACRLQRPGVFYFRAYSGGLKNWLYMGRRGEGSPAPWLMLRVGRFGIQLDRAWQPWRTGPGYLIYGPVTLAKVL